MFKLDNVLFDLRDRIQPFLENIIPQIELKQLNFQFDIDKNVPNWIESDFNKIQNILLNLIGNSIKYTNNGYIKVKVQLKNKEEYNN